MRQIKTVIYTIALKMNEAGRLCQHRWELNAGMLTAQCKPVHQFAHPECNYKIVSVQFRRWRVIQGVKTADTGDNPMIKLKREPTNESNRSMQRVFNTVELWHQPPAVILCDASGVRGNRPIIWKCNKLFIFMNDWVEWLSDCQSNRILH